MEFCSQIAFIFSAKQETRSSAKSEDWSLPSGGGLGRGEEV